MRIGVLGTGMVGKILAAGFTAKGHDVIMGTRDPEASHDVPEGVRIAGFEDAARHGEVVVLCVHGMAGETVVRNCGDTLDGKLVLDTTNPLQAGPDGAHRPDSVKDSLLQTLQRAAPRAHFVKAWNCVPGPMMVDPPFRGTQFICGDGGKEQAAEILASFGWEALDVGGADKAPYVEGMALAVINHGMASGDWAWGLQLMRA